MIAAHSPLSVNSTAKSQTFVAYWLVGYGRSGGHHGGYRWHHQINGKRIVDGRVASINGNTTAIKPTEWQRVFDLYRASPEYEQLNKGMDLGGFKTIFFWEYFHRLWGRLLGLHSVYHSSFY